MHFSSFSQCRMDPPEKNRLAFLPTQRLRFPMALPNFHLPHLCQSLVLWRETSCLQH
jgi:hypothetical protein